MFYFSMRQQNVMDNVDGAGCGWRVVGFIVPGNGFVDNSKARTCKYGSGKSRWALAGQFRPWNPVLAGGDV